MDWSSTVGEGFDDKSRRLSHPSEGFRVDEQQRTAISGCHFEPTSREMRASTQRGPSSCPAGWRRKGGPGGGSHDLSSLRPDACTKSRSHPIISCRHVSEAMPAREARDRIQCSPHHDLSGNRAPPRRPTQAPLRFRRRRRSAAADFFAEVVPAGSVHRPGASPIVVMIDSSGWAHCGDRPVAATSWLVARRLTIGRIDHRPKAIAPSVALAGTATCDAVAVVSLRPLNRPVSECSPTRGTLRARR